MSAKNCQKVSDIHDFILLMPAIGKQRLKPECSTQYITMNTAQIHVLYTPAPFKSKL